MREFLKGKRWWEERWVVVGHINKGMKIGSAFFQIQFKAGYCLKCYINVIYMGTLKIL